MVFIMKHQILKSLACAGLLLSALSVGAELPKRDLLLDLRSLKQQLEFEAKLERSMPPELKGVTAAVTEPGIASEAKRHPRALYFDWKAGDSRRHFR